MTIDPTPKPIRYRITSGGREHFSLESLRSFFCWHEIKGLIQERRIQEWLKSIGEETIADLIDHAQNQGANDCTISAIFYGLENTGINEWPQMVEYWSSNRYFDSLCLNLNEWVRVSSFSLVRQVQEKLPKDYWEKVVEFAYGAIKNLPPETNRRAWTDVAEMGSFDAKKVLSELKQKEEQEKLKQEQEKKKQEQALARKAAQKSLEGLIQDWDQNKKLKKDCYDTDLRQLVGFLIDMRDLLQGAKGVCDQEGRQCASSRDKSVADLTSIIQKIDKKVNASRFGDYYKCSITLAFIFLNYNTADSVTKRMDHKSIGPVSKYFSSRHDYSSATIKNVAKVWFLSNQKLLDICQNYGNDRSAGYFNAFDGVIKKLGSYLLEHQKTVYG